MTHALNTTCITESVSIWVGGKQIVTLYPDGRVEVPDGAELDETAARFWQEIAAFSPFREMKAENEGLRAALEWASENRASPDVAGTASDRQWQPMDTAPRDRTRVLVVFRADLVERFAGFDASNAERLSRWAGIPFVARHEGYTPSGYDMGWSFAAPVGQGGFDTAWLAGWMPLPEPPNL